ncbi:MAG: cupredoxin domain-containing protein [Acidimicrobiia bacterium]
MSTTELDQREDNEPATARAAEPARRVSPALNDRVLTPLLLPIGAILFFAAFVISLSRIFLSGTGRPALVVAMAMTAIILVGAAVMSAAKGSRAQTAGLTLLGLVAIVMLGGLLTLGASQEKKKEATGFVPPTGPAVATTAIQSGPTLTFTPNTVDTKPGVNQFDLTSTPGHTFQIHQIPGFKIDMAKAGKYTGKVELKAGTYNFFCGIPGHEAAGMKGVITVAS